MNREKKQMVVLGVLALMIVCVGAFQMTGGSPEPVAPAKAKDTKATAKTSTKEEKPKLANPDQAYPLPKRDPFAPSEFAIAANEDPANVRANAPVSEVPPPKANNSAGKPSPLPKGDPEAWPPGGQTDTSVPPVIPQPPKFSYSLIGFVSGKYPAAVFSDATGNQKLVEVGSAIDSTATLIAVFGNKVKVKFHDQTLFLTVGGNPNGK